MMVDGERKFTGILHDLSARVRIEEQLREQTTLARLGEMAAVIAHEVKNPLAGMRGAIQVIGGRLPKDSKDAAMIKEIVARIDALNELMKDCCCSRARRSRGRRRWRSRALVAATAELLRQRSGAQGRRMSRSTGRRRRSLADAELLKIVFQNLLVNGAQAMQGRGTIRVSLTAIDDDVPDRVQRQRAGHSRRRCGTRSSRRSSPPRRAGRAWACRRPSASSRRTTARSASSARRGRRHDGHGSTSCPAQAPDGDVRQPSH